MAAFGDAEVISQFVTLVIEHARMGNFSAERSNAGDHHHGCLRIGLFKTIIRGVLPTKFVQQEELNADTRLTLPAPLDP